ncbi:nicotinate-nicotinamide nucleotide adenylyltransferase [Psychrobacter aquaticus]|uniref:Probable nicotinate-nucleotide adenylyltransferase n=1 Tax=Psychrobacter aquaticus CMS 56 TaxID=1354303 RepID=U4T713_9GAMM|nr:nicotinate-nicotinamide nucleotide adenylyltransferase [Psychrobacter aquaticus]ERL54283.1 Nicotinate-nucleotide adenylyltransferase [Psychrobacter aquaticus CMS 56]
MPTITNDRHDKHSAPTIRAYLGGSFDPVHSGHVQMAMTVYHCLLPIATLQQRDLRVSLLPNARSPFKTHSTDPAHRLAMLKLATRNTPLQINELELWQTPPVYTIDSVRTLRQRYPNDCLIFIMGIDSARSLDQWKDGLRLTDYVNLWIFSRHGMNSVSDVYNDVRADNLVEENLTKQETAALQAQLPTPLQNLVIDAPTELLLPPSQTLADSSALKNAYKGHIYIDNRPVMAISSTELRQQLQSTTNRSNTTAPAETQTTFVTPINAIISNTTSNPFVKWLNPAVYHYIIAHQLYSAAQFR